MSPPVVVLDACTLYPAALRDVLMRLALHQLILARWTDAIHDEWIEAVLRDRSDLTRERLQRTRELMDLHAEGSLVTGYERRMQDLELPDVDDRHVLAAAIEAEAGIILTWNLRDFPEAVLVCHGLRAATPDELLAGLIEDHQERMIAVFREARLSLKQPPPNISQPCVTKLSRAPAPCSNTASSNSDVAMLNPATKQQNDAIRTHLRSNNYAVLDIPASHLNDPVSLGAFLYNLARKLVTKAQAEDIRDGFDTQKSQEKDDLNYGPRPCARLFGVI